MKDQQGKLIRKGDVYQIDFDPSKGSEIQKIRPALVIQDHYVAENSRTILVCPITSSDTIHPFDIAVREKFLTKGSRIRTIQIYSCDISRFGKFFGALSEDSLYQVYNKIFTLMGF